MMVPRLGYDDSYKNIKRFSCFVDKSLVLHKARILETLHFKLDDESAAVHRNHSKTDVIGEIQGGRVTRNMIQTTRGQATDYLTN